MDKKVSFFDRKHHWDNVYQTKNAKTGVSWYQEDPKLSLELICEVCPKLDAKIIDIGGGASVLVDKLLDLGCQSISVLDISEAALQCSKSRLGDIAKNVEWIVADITETEEVGSFDIWHDRAVFHFLTSKEQQSRYRELAEKSISSGGYLIISTFGLNGPNQCSGIDVCRYDAEGLARVLGNSFHLEKSFTEIHTTPWNSEQEFIYGVFRMMNPKSNC